MVCLCRVLDHVSQLHIVICVHLAFAWLVVHKLHELYIYCSGELLNSLTRPCNFKHYKFTYMFQCLLKAASSGLSS